MQTSPAVDLDVALARAAWGPLTRPQLVPFPGKPPDLESAAPAALTHYPLRRLRRRLGVAAALLVGALALLALQPAQAMDHVARCLALAVYHEARGEPPIAQLGVMHVGLNRSAVEPGTVCNVIMRPGQFHVPFFPAEHEPAWIAAQVLVENALDYAVPDPTGGALYFVSADLRPAWTRDLEPLRLGRLTFYRPAR